MLKIDRDLLLIRSLAEARGEVLWNISVGNFGYAFRWRNRDREGSEPSVIYGYYPTLSGAIAGEIKRLEEK